MLEKDAIEGNTERMKADMARISGAAEKSVDSWMSYWSCPVLGVWSIPREDTDG